MNTGEQGISASILLAAAATAGIIIAFIGNFSFAGEVSSLVILALLLAATTVFGAIGGRQRYWIALAVWVWLPLFQLMRHLFGLNDILEPDTYSSIVLLGAFTLIIAMVGTTAGVMLRRLFAGYQHRGHRGSTA